MSKQGKDGRHKLQKWLKKGGEAQMRRMAVAELYDVEGVERERSSAAGMKTLVGPLLNPKLKLTPQQRAAGQVYGGYVEEMYKAGGAEWIREFVDGGGVGNGGINESQFMKMAMVVLARNALQKEKPLRYPLGKSRKVWRGKHRPINLIDLVDAVCVNGRTIELVAVVNGWVTMRDGKIVAPDRQRKRIAAGLRHGLDTIIAAWDHHSPSVLHEASMVESE